MSCWCELGCVPTARSPPTRCTGRQYSSSARLRRPPCWSGFCRSSHRRRLPSTGAAAITRLNTIPKHATHEQYAKATGLETLFGALYLSGQTERINTLFTWIMEDLNAI